MHGRLIAKRLSRPALWLLILLVCQRSFIAPGYMLDTASSGGLAGFTVTICNGFNGINRIHGLDPVIHHHHGGHEQHGGPQSKPGDHFTAVCGLWTASGTGAGTTVPDLSPLLLPAGNRHPPDYSNPPARLSFYRKHSPRAPPAFVLS